MSSWWRAISCSSVSISVSSIGCLRHRPSMRDMRARNEISIDALSALLTAKRVAPATHERQGYRRLFYMRFETVPTAVPSRTLRNPAFAGWRSLCFCSVQSNRWNVLLVRDLGPAVCGAARMVARNHGITGMMALAGGWICLWSLNQNLGAFRIEHLCK
jgi:hypothetical protein